MENQYQIKIEKMVFGGDGMGHLPDGRAVFVPYVLPDELVKIELVENKKRFAKAKLIEIIEPSSKRIIPVCPYFSSCGGCHYQHMTYEDQINLKRDVFIDQFQRLAKMDIAEKLVVFGSDAEHNYRNSIQLHVNEMGKLGFQVSHSREVIAVDQCFLPIGKFPELLELLDFGEETDVNRIQCRWGSDGDLLVLLKSPSALTPEMELDLDASVVHQSPAGEIVLAGENHQWFDVNGETFIVSANSFFQANTAQSEKMVSYLLENLPVSEETILVDVYCGVGLFSKFFAPRVKECIGIEASDSSAADFIVNLEALDNVALYEGPAEHIFPYLEEKPDVVILDPPRAGLNVKVTDALGESDVHTIGYVSCDPSTLVRDIKRLSKYGFELVSVALFDQFPQTYHIEGIVILAR